MGVKNVLKNQEKCTCTYQKTIAGIILIEQTTVNIYVIPLHYEMEFQNCLKI